jgi:predicted membrane protein
LDYNSQKKAKLEGQPFYNFFPIKLKSSVSCSIPATEACDGFNYMGIPSYREEYSWDWSKPVVRDAEELSGVSPPPPPTLYSVQSSISCHVRCLLFCVIWQASEFCNQFYRSYFLTIEQEIFAVLTDTFHKPGFKLHVLVLQHLFCSVCVLQLSFS